MVQLLLLDIESGECKMRKQYQFMNVRRQYYYVRFQIDKYKDAVTELVVMYHN